MKFIIYTPYYFLKTTMKK